MKIAKYYPPHDKNETEPVWLSPVFAIFQAPPCKVIRVVTRTTNYKQSPTTVNIDRPAHIKTDKQCRTHTTSKARLPDD